MSNVHTCLHHFVKSVPTCLTLKIQVINVFCCYAQLSTYLSYLRSLHYTSKLEHPVGPPCFSGFPHLRFIGYLKVRKPVLPLLAFPHSMWAMALIKGGMAHIGQEWYSTIYNFRPCEVFFEDIHISYLHQKCTYEFDVE